ncbi:TPA: hypothetical protein ACN18G_004347 [Escherichia coli]|nr:MULTISPECIES: hypothetical protein [Enterobacteriaceae]MDZ9735660.1 hypothetical protein [Escherichia coli]MDZ9966211.1 hypothetical protein [Escherichia coli]
MRHTTITARDLECLEHMRNVGQLDGVVERCNQQWLTGEGNV